MNDHLTRFIAALRSGNYAQGLYSLRQGETYCAQGVACDLFDPNGWEMPSPECYRFQGKRADMPQHVRLSLGIELVVAETIIKMNDEQGASFADIAEYLEGLE